MLRRAQEGCPIIEEEIKDDHCGQSNQHGENRLAVARQGVARNRSGQVPARTVGRQENRDSNPEDWNCS